VFEPRPASVVLERFLAEMIGKECWSMIASEGGNLLLSFGAKVPLDRPSKNKTLSAEERENEGELAVFVSCAWRIESASDVIAVWSDPISKDTPLPRGAEVIKGARVVGARASSPAYDLELRFDQGWILRVFCDQPIFEIGNTNYTVSRMRHVVSIESGGKLSVESPRL